MLPVKTSKSKNLPEQSVVKKNKLNIQRSMEILSTEDGSDDSRPSSASSSRPSSSSRSGKTPWLSGSDRVPRTPTPTKNVLLEAVKRKESKLADLPDISLLHLADGDKFLSKSQTLAVASKSNAVAENSDSDCSESEVIKAPNELMLEFLECMMQKDYTNAQKLCKMILLYEPAHPQASQFLPLLEIKIQQEEEKAQRGEESESSDNSDDDDSDTDDEGVELVSSEGSSSSDESEESSNEEHGDSYSVNIY